MTRSLRLSVRAYKRSLAIVFVAMGTAPAIAAPNEARAFEERLLDAHNLERDRLGLKRLQWDDDLARDAARWARYLSATRKFDHAPQRGDANDQGENLWMGTTHAYSAEEMVGAWIDEKRMYRNGVFPNVSRTGRWMDVGHYVQIVWHNTRRVGCALSEGGGDEYLVCRYFPPGNWEGERPLGDSGDQPRLTRR